MQNETLTTGLARDYRRDASSGEISPPPQQRHGPRAWTGVAWLAVTLLSVAAIALVAPRFLPTAQAYAQTGVAIVAALLAVLLVTAGFLLARILPQPITSRANRNGRSARTHILRDVSGDLEERTIALQKEVARVNAILGSIADGVIVRDTDGEVILTNAEAKALLDKLPNFRQSPLANLGENHADDDSPEDPLLPQTHRIELADRVVSARSSPVQTERGEVIGEVIVMRDVTSEAAADRLKDDFINSISHELRTPLTVIKGYSDVLMLGAQKGLQPTDLDKKLGAIYTHAEALESMIRQIIDLSEMAAGTLHLDLRPTDLNALLQDVAHEWHERLHEARQSLQLDLGDEEMLIEADARRLRWAIDAVLHNACQYSPGPGKVAIALSTLESAAVIQIRDKGVGIVRDDLPHVFERFYRGKSTQRDGSVLDPRGVGQGLYVVKSVVEAHRGRVWIESEVGEGTVVSILLPLSEPTP